MLDFLGNPIEPTSSIVKQNRSPALTKEERAIAQVGIKACLSNSLYKRYGFEFYILLYYN
nr:hypothetical protein [Mammaliicoccus vitulinus]